MLLVKISVILSASLLSLHLTKHVTDMYSYFHCPGLDGSSLSFLVPLHPASKLYENAAPMGPQGPLHAASADLKPARPPNHSTTNPRCTAAVPCTQAPALLRAAARNPCRLRLFCAQLIKAAEQPDHRIGASLEGRGQACPSARVGPGLGLEQGPLTPSPADDALHLDVLVLLLPPTCRSALL